MCRVSQGSLYHATDAQQVADVSSSLVTVFFGGNCRYDPAGGLQKEIGR